MSKYFIFINNRFILFFFSSMKINGVEIRLFCFANFCADPVGPRKKDQESEYKASTRYYFITWFLLEDSLQPCNS